MQRQGEGSQVPDEKISTLIEIVKKEETDHAEKSPEEESSNIREGKFEDKPSNKSQVGTY